MDLDDEELKATRILHGVEPEVCHCKTDLNKVSEIMKEREEKAFKYDCLRNKIIEKIKELVVQEEEEFFDNRKSIQILQELLKEEV